MSLSLLVDRTVVVQLIQLEIPPPPIHPHTTTTTTTTTTLGGYTLPCTCLNANENELLTL